MQSILIVEDDSATASLLASALEGFDCIHRQSMAGAAHYLSQVKRERPEELPLVIVLDFGLRDSYSYATVDRIPILSKYSAVICMTGEGDEILEKIAIEKGAKKYYSKPVRDLERFIEDITELARIEQMNRALTQQSEKAASFADRIERTYLTNGTANGK